MKWTGPQILHQLPELTLMCAGMGTAGTMTGTAISIKATKPECFTLGVCTANGDRVPGPRTEPMLEPVMFPYRDCVDTIEHVNSKDSYSLSMKLCRLGILCGPSSGLALKGLLQHLEDRSKKGTLSRIRNSSDGQAHCVFICCDLPFQYIGEYFEKVDDDSFPPIHNEVLLDSDRYRYDDSWEMGEAEANKLILDQDAGTILHLTNKEGNTRTTLPNLAFNRNWEVLQVQLSTLYKSKHIREDSDTEMMGKDSHYQCPFANPDLLSDQWKELDCLFHPSSIHFNKLKKTTLVICPTGSTSRIASSILNNHGIQAFSLSKETDVQPNILK